MRLGPFGSQQPQIVDYWAKAFQILEKVRTCILLECSSIIIPGALVKAIWLGMNNVNLLIQSTPPVAKERVCEKSKDEIS
ncbi:hypothetical protein SLEP1_g390 [Rubroshorea leprosula]|uniref:Uncharacterized protein n=1 Tax=Rubroshorea leprosula TaxID=152421 RepID=A0AAV5HH02_9ROSI|nr:hypothetical protein SLEP1_g390 [Rubroshorea leprosula]